MAASTITRDTITNDTGSAANPNLDGTVLNQSFFNNSIYGRIDEMFAGAGSYAAFTFGGRVNAEGFGAHQFWAGGTGANTLSVRNSTAGTGNYGSVGVLGDDINQGGAMLALSSTYTTSGDLVAGGFTIRANGVGGMSLTAGHASGVIRFFTGGTATETARLTTAAELRVGSGSVSTPAYSFTADTDSGFWWDNSSVFIGCGINGTEVFRVIGGTGGGIALRVADYGSGNIPSGVILQRNSNATDPVAGWIFFTSQDSTGAYVWRDGSGDYRTGTLGNLQSDNAGTVIGTQTSQRAAKDLLGTFTDDAAALALIRATPLHRFRYKSGSFNDQEFIGIVAEDSPQFAMDAGRVFNPISTFGYTVAAIRELARRLERLEQMA